MAIRQRPRPGVPLASPCGRRRQAARPDAGADVGVESPGLRPTGAHRTQHSSTLSPPVDPAWILWSPAIGGAPLSASKVRGTPTPSSHIRPLGPHGGARHTSELNGAVNHPAAHKHRAADDNLADDGDDRHTIKPVGRKRRRNERRQLWDFRRECGIWPDGRARPRLVA